MATLYTHQSSNVTKTWILMTGFFVLVVGLGFVFAEVYRNTSFLVIALVLSLAMNVASYWFSDKIVLGMVGAKRVTREDAPDLWNIVENLAITAGLPMPALYVVDDPSLNAFATGRDKEHAAVAVHTGLLKVLNRTELEGVLAHELSHVGNRDTLVATVVIVLVGLVGMLSDFFLRMSFWGNDRDNKGNAVMMVFGIIFAVLAPIVAMLIQLAISRKREFLADASGALLTRYPEGLASALEKIGASAQSSATARPAIAHLYIDAPFRGRAATAWHAKLFMTHPPIEERIAILRGMEVK